MRTLPLLFPHIFTNSISTRRRYPKHLMRTRLTHNEDQSGYTLTMKHSALHGRSVEDITLSVERDILSLHISALDLDLPTHARPIWEEISRDEYSQSVKLPQGIDASSIQARLIDHELILNLPKLTPVKHQISISNAA